MMYAYTYTDNLGIVIMLAHAQPKKQKIFCSTHLVWASLKLTQLHG